MKKKEYTHPAIETYKMETTGALLVDSLTISSPGNKAKNEYEILSIDDEDGTEGRPVVW